MTNYSWLYGSIKALETWTSKVFNLSFPSSTIFPCFFFFFFIVDLYFLILAGNPQISIPHAELVIPTRTQAYEANAEIETQPLTVEAKISKCSI